MSSSIHSPGRKYPSFLSMQYLDKEDHKRLDLRWREIESFLNARMGADADLNPGDIVR